MKKQPKYSVVWMCYNQKYLFDVYAESVKDYEVEIILSDDGSTDGSKEEAKKRGWTVVGNKVNKGFDIITGANQAAKVAQGEYLVYFTGDTHPHPEFIEQCDYHVSPTRLLNGLRLQIDKETGKIISNDWRVLKINVDWLQDYIPVVGSNPWEVMQSNGMVIPKVCYNELGGMLLAYRYHPGACDTDLCAHAYFKGYELGIVPKAVCYHRWHTEHFDDAYSTNLKQKRIKYFQETYGKRI
jgi:GT2 family glycosyltransferase